MHILTSEQINAYCEQFSSPEGEVLHDLNRQTHLRTELPIMLSGHLQGRVLSMLSHMIRPMHILEIGTFTGYSALCLAEGLQPQGKLITIDTNPETSALCMEYVEKKHLEDKINVMVGKASDIIPALNLTFDLVFIDADKTNYSLYFDLVADKVNQGGYILADNVLYHGDVLNLDQAGKNAKAMHAYNEKINEDNRFESVLLPLRDGIMISRKK